MLSIDTRTLFFLLQNGLAHLFLHVDEVESENAIKRNINYEKMFIEKNEGYIHKVISHPANEILKIRAVTF